MSEWSQAYGVEAMLSSLLPSFFDPRQTSRHLRFPGGLVGEPPSSFFAALTVIPTFSAMRSNLTLAGELLLLGLSLFFGLMSLAGRDGDIGGDIGCGEFGGLDIPSREPSLKRLWAVKAVLLLVMEATRGIWG